MKNISPVVTIIFTIIIIVIVTAGIAPTVHSHHAQPAKSAPSSHATAARFTTNTPALTAKSTEPNTAQLQLAIVHKGKGVESAFIRQLAANPVIYGFKGKQDDTKAVRQWESRQAHLLAIKTGYYDWKFGAEVRVAIPDTMAYVIQKDAAGNLTIVEYTMTTTTTITASTAPPTFSQ